MSAYDRWLERDRIAEDQDKYSEALIAWEESISIIEEIGEEKASELLWSIYGSESDDERIEIQSRIRALLEARFSENQNDY